MAYGLGFTTRIRSCHSFDLISLIFCAWALANSLLIRTWRHLQEQGRTADLTVEDSAAGIVSLTNRLRLADSGSFLNWLGEEMPY